MYKENNEALKDHLRRKWSRVLNAPIKNVRKEELARSRPKVILQQAKAATAAVIKRLLLAEIKCFQSNQKSGDVYLCVTVFD